MTGMIGVRFQNLCFIECVVFSPLVSTAQSAHDTPNSVRSSDDEKNRPAVQFAHSSVRTWRFLHVIPGRTRLPEALINIYLYIIDD